MFRLLIGSIIFVGSSCATMDPATVSSENAPKDFNKNKTQAVMYNSQGIDEVVRLRREDAFKKMRETCGSNNYEILSQKAMDADDAPPSDSLATVAAAEITRIEFVCK